MIGFYRFGSSATDDGVDIDFVLEGNHIAPAGVGGECVFLNYYLAITYNGAFDLTVIPIVDGELLRELAHTLVVDSIPTNPITRIFEIGLKRAFEETPGVEKIRHSPRGAWFGVRLEGFDRGQLCGILELEGDEVEYEVVQESLPFRQVSIAELALPAREVLSKHFFGGMGGSADLFLWGAGDDDAGIAVDWQTEGNPTFPAGIGGELAFYNLYLAVSHANLTDYPITVIPILYARETVTELPAITVTVPGVAGPKVADVFEIGFHQTYQAQQTYAPRGQGIAWRLEGPGYLPDGVFIIEGAELEYDPVSETMEAENAT